MRILILGGSVFLGAAALHCALQRGHQVTVFNRGRARSVWPAGVEALTGDRSNDLGSITGRNWDAVIDTSGYLPQQVRSSAAALRGCGRYLFVSSISAYASFGHAPIPESDALASFRGVDANDRSPQFYGAQKAACESELVKAFGEQALIVRPGLIVGPGDPTGRFSYWPWRVAAGGAMLVPAVPAVPEAPAPSPLQFIDVRDLAEWLVLLLEQGCSGVFNATGPAPPTALDWADLVATCSDAARAGGMIPAEPVPMGEAFLAEQGVKPWSELPLWLPSSDESMLGFMRIDTARAVTAGLHTRPLRDTVAAILQEPTPAANDARRSGKLSRETEAQLLQRWRALSDCNALRGSEP